MGICGAKIVSCNGKARRGGRYRLKELAEMWWFKSARSRGAPPEEQLTCDEGGFCRVAESGVALVSAVVAVGAAVAAAAATAAVCPIICCCCCCCTICGLKPWGIMPGGKPWAMPCWGVTCGAPCGIPWGIPCGIPCGIPWGIPCGIPCGIPWGMPAAKRKAVLETVSLAHCLHSEGIFMLWRANGGLFWGVSLLSSHASPFQKETMNNRPQQWMPTIWQLEEFDFSPPLQRPTKHCLTLKHLPNCLSLKDLQWFLLEK